MARKANKETVEQHNGPPKSADEIFDEHFPQISAAHLALEKAQKAQREANAVYRNYLKDFKKAGGNTEALIDALRDQKLDPQDVSRRIDAYNRYARRMGMPIGTQWGLFADGQTVATKVDNDKIGAGEKDQGPERLTEKSLHAIGEDGFAAGFNGKNADTNPYEEGSPAFLKWAAGYRDGQAKLAKGLAPKPKAAAAPAVDHSPA